MTERESLADLVYDTAFGYRESGVRMRRDAYWFRIADAILASQWLADRDGEHYDAGREDCEQEYKQSAGDFISGSWR